MRRSVRMNRELFRQYALNFLIALHLGRRRPDSRLRLFGPRSNCLLRSVSTPPVIEPRKCTTGSKPIEEGRDLGPRFLWLFDSKITHVAMFLTNRRSLKLRAGLENPGREAAASKRLHSPETVHESQRPSCGGYPKDCRGKALADRAHVLCDVR